MLLAECPQEQHKNSVHLGMLERLGRVVQGQSVEQAHLMVLECSEQTEAAHQGLEPKAAILKPMDEEAVDMAILEWPSFAHRSPTGQLLDEGPKPNLHFETSQVMSPSVRLTGYLSP